MHAIVFHIQVPPMGWLARICESSKAVANHTRPVAALHSLYHLPRRRCPVLSPPFPCMHHIRLNYILVPKQHPASTPSTSTKLPVGVIVVNVCSVLTLRSDQARCTYLRTSNLILIDILVFSHPLPLTLCPPHRAMPPYPAMDPQNGVASPSSLTYPVAPFPPTRASDANIVYPRFHCWDHPFFGASFVE